MPFNLSFPGLLPSTPYSVSIDMLIGEELIDTLRSFSVTTPPILNGRLKDTQPENVAIGTVWQTTAAFQAAQPSRVETFSTNVSQVKAHLKGRDLSGRKATDWTGSKNNLKKSESADKYAPVVVFTMQLTTSQQGFQISKIEQFNSKPGVSEIFGVLKSIGYLQTDGENKFEFEVSAADPALRMTFKRKAVKKKSYWEGNIRTSFFKAKDGNNNDESDDGGDTNYKKSRGFLPYTANLIGVKTIPPTPELAEVGFTVDKLSASASADIFGQLETALQSAGPTAKYSIHFLYCDTNSSDTPPDSAFIYLDSAFSPATGVNNGEVQYTAASGTFFKVGSTFNLPDKDNPPDSANVVLSQRLLDKVIFDNRVTGTASLEQSTVRPDGTIVAGETRTGTVKPNQIWIAYTVVQHFLNPQNGTWTRSFAYTTDGNPAISAPTRLGSS
jgi:hypothetical protein